MRILITGGQGRLARRLVPELQGLRHITDAPGRHELPMGSSASPVRLAERIRVGGVDLVVALAALTDVACTSHRAHFSANVWTVLNTNIGCLCAGKIPFLYISTDYVLSNPSEDTEYTRSKRAGEDIARHGGGTVVRIAIAHPETCEEWGWVNGYSLAHREWAPASAKRLAEFIHRCAWRNPAPDAPHGAAYQLGPREASTKAQMLRERFPDHPALRNVVMTPEEHIRRVGYAAPRDTRFDRLWRPEW